MYTTETLPQWFWIIYYSLGFLTIAAAVFSIKQKQMVWRSLMTIFITLSIPVVGIANGIYREEHQDEWEQWLAHLGSGSLWAYYLLSGYLWIVIWWGMFIRKRVWGKKSSAD
ncbi:hypothetical protein HF072_05105 [Bacillus sp. RO3]|nr:hypothetical protein [Bacillus sp. RO3]